MVQIRDADLPRDLDAVRRLWLEYLTWGNDELESHFGFRLPVQDTVEHDIATIARFQPPEGRLLMAIEDDVPIGTACLRRLTPDTAELKRMYVEPAHRGAGVGRALLAELIAVARNAGFERVRLDSTNFMTDAHRLYRSMGFVEIGPYPESEIPDAYKPHWVFMERSPV